MALSEKEYIKYRDSVFEFLWKEIEPHVEDFESKEKIPKKEFFPKFREKGLFGLMVPKKYGGIGLSVTQYLPILAEESKVHGGIRVLLHVHNVTARLMAEYGSEDQKRKYLPEVALGELSFAFGLTEANAGTGQDIKTVAEKKGDFFVVNGEKHLITNADFTKYFMVFCYTNKDLGARGISNLIVDRDTVGFHIEKHKPLLGCRGSSHGILNFHNCKVPINMVVGKEGEGLEQALKELEVSRVFIAATALGTAERALNISIEHAKKRVTFGKAISERQAVQTYLADMAIEVFALKAMLEKTARLIDKGKPVPIEGCACKTFGAETACRVTEIALQVLGGIGYTRAYPVERLHRDARLNLLEEGALTIQRMVIARHLIKGTKI